MSNSGAEGDAKNSVEFATLCLCPSTSWDVMVFLKQKLHKSGLN
jgi:hypothetical protein